MLNKTALKKDYSQKGFSPILLILTVVMILGLGFLGYQAIMNQPSSNLPTFQQQNPLVQKTSTKPRSLASGIITQAVVTKSTDPKTGAAINPGSTFSKTDPVINLIVSLKNPKMGTKIEYVRYLNNKFLDNRSMSTTKATDTSVVFDWPLKKTGAMHLVGNYRVKLYTNGVFEKEVIYSVQ